MGMVRRILALAALLGLGACAAPPQTIADVRFAEGDVLDTHARVRLHVDPGAHDPEQVHLEVRLGDGQPLYVGSARLAMVRSPRLKVPARTQSLDVTARFPDGTTRSAELDVVGGAVDLSLGAF